MDLSTFLNKTSILPPAACAALDEAFRLEKLPKGHRLFLPDSYPQKVYFIEEGLMRTYYLKESKDITHYFFKENSFTMPIECIFYNRPAPFGLELLENSIIRSIPYPELEKYIDLHPAIEKLMRLLLIDILKSFSDMMNAFQFQSAQERYKGMLEKHPDILLRAPLGHIASYLGITPQTLSVIRAQKS